MHRRAGAVAGGLFFIECMHQPARLRKSWTCACRYCIFELSSNTVFTTTSNCVFTINLRLHLNSVRLELFRMHILCVL